MRSVLDRSIFREATTDSGALAIMNSIVHRMADQGDYRGTVYRGEARVGTFLVSVHDNPEGPGAERDALPRQATVDLAALDGSAGGAPGDCQAAFSLAAGGHLVLSVSAGSGRYAVEIVRRERRKEPAKVFDSQALGAGDIFVATLVRPGTYRVRDLLGNGQAELTVEYPESGRLAARARPVVVECGEGAMDPAAVRIQPGQALMFSCRRECRIAIDLERADDRRPPGRRPAAAPAPAAKKGKTRRVLRRIRFYG
ncbi:MAG: hypothetical protein ABFC38_07375 [Methanospirillum sp.]